MNNTGWAFLFLIMAGVFALFGFTGVQNSTAGLFHLLFVIFLVLALANVIFGRNHSRFF